MKASKHTVTGLPQESPVSLDSSSGDHPSHETLFAFFEDEIFEGDRPRMEKHIDQCNLCDDFLLFLANEPSSRQVLIPDLKIERVRREAETKAHEAARSQLARQWRRRMTGLATLAAILILLPSVLLVRAYRELDRLAVPHVGTKFVTARASGTRSTEDDLPGTVVQFKPEDRSATIAIPIDRRWGDHSHSVRLLDRNANTLWSSRVLPLDPQTHHGFIWIPRRFVKEGKFYLEVCAHREGECHEKFIQEIIFTAP